VPPRTEIPALPSSLAPLPGESLPGYLLRLAWRLELPPARIAGLCGLAGRLDHRQVQVDYLICLPPDTAARFSRAAGLTAGEAAGLTLSRFSHSYPLAARQGSGTVMNAYTGTWAASFSSRYCPQCLADGARRPEGSFGGAWQLDWHLPAVFACAVHRKLLEHACPACGSALNSDRRGRVTLISRPDAAGLHPHQCRNPDGAGGEGRQQREPICGGRLDAPPAPSRGQLPPADLDRLLALQEKTRQRLDAGADGGPGGGTAYFTDLVATARLLILGWPEGAGLAGSGALASLIDEHASPVRSALSAARDKTERPRRARRDVNIWGAPASPAQCGALILAADAAISGTDQAGLRDRIQSLAAAAARSHPVQFRFVRTMDTSPAYRRAIAPRGYGLRHAAARPGLLPPSRECLFTIEEVPPLLPQQRHDDHLADLAARIPGPRTARTPRHLRRLASLKLAEMTAGGTWRQCAEQLGIPAGSAERSVEVLRSQLGTGGLWEEFDEITEQIARALDEDEQRVNYARRRRALEQWHIPASHWEAVCAGTRRGSGPRIGPQDPAIGTVLIWESTTQADHLHSPLLTSMRRDGTARALNTKIARFRTPAARRGSRLVILNRIEKYAALLARQCDDHVGTNITLDELLPWEPPRQQASPDARS